MILHRNPWQDHNGASHRKNFDTPPLVGNSPVAPATHELLLQTPEDMRIAETHEFLQLMSKVGHYDAPNE